MIYPTDEDPQDKVLVKAFNDRLKEQEHGQNMSDRIASRNRGTLPRTIYDFINQIVGRSLPFNTVRATLPNGLMRDANDIAENTTTKDEEIGKIATGHILRVKNRGGRENLM